MNRMHEQAAAIRQMVTSGIASDDRELVSASAISCGISLLEHGDYTTALSLVDDALKEASVLVPRQALALEVIRIRALLNLARVPEASDRVASALVEFQQSGVSHLDEWLQLRAFEAGCHWRQNNQGHAVRMLEGLRAELVSRADGPATCISALELATAQSLSGDRVGARASCLEAWVAARRIDHAHWRAFSEFHLAILERVCSRWQSANEYLFSAETTFRAAENYFMVSRCVQARALIEWKQGALSRALETTAVLRSELSTADLHQNYWYASLLRAVVLTHMGRFAEAEKTLREEPDWQVPSKFSRASLLTVEYLGDLDLEQGHAETANKRFSAALTQAMALVPRGDIVAELRRRIAECHLLQGESRKALDLAREALEHCREIRERYDEAATHRIIALASAALGLNEEAKKAFDDGFVMFDESETPYEWGKLWMAYGDWRCSEGAAAYRNDSAAIEAYRAAIDHFERMGAEYKLGEARAQLEALEGRMKDEGADYAPTSDKVRPARRPRLSAELLRRSQWALDTFATVTRSAHLITMLEEVASVAVSDIPVLILGESGTGKELVARGVHSLSGRTGEFLAINCSAVPETMLEGEFFGYMRGAFTNAVADKPGLFEMAHGGTVFLDEIGEMSPDLQSKLLRFLETGTLRRVGATRETQVETRIVAATNRERSTLQAGDGFRSDLYYRLAHAVYELPPLRERGDDVDLLVDHYLDFFNRQNRRSVRLSPAVRTMLLRHGWPGNVREMRSILHKLVVAARADGVITPRDVPALEAASAPANYMDERDAGEKKRILRALEQTRFVKTDAAKILRISRTTLVGKMKRLGMGG